MSTEEKKKLLQTVAMLEEELTATRMRMQNLQSTILSNISHDIRTPMNAIVGFANLLTDEKMDPGERKDCIDHINSHSIELLGIIDNMIDASQLQSGNIRLNEQECYLNEILDDIYHEARETQNIKQKKISLTVTRGEDDDFFIYADYKRLKQILYNLVDNAGKFTRKGFIQFGYSKGKNNRVTFFVRDTGEGLGLMNKDDLFRPFHTGNKPQGGEPARGLGLGLSISKSLVELMNGKMWHESGPCNGSCFYFTLPVKKNSLFRTTYQHLSTLAKRNIASIF
jgi:signal transduction histidine kinase